ncbi:MAG: RiPP maturation radical SAM C-methyltransferase [Desulfobacterales bacterium]|uniref:RiPP maturation radical SAM protein 1 n=1 Tax=Candidatus Desulfaltia bathyphila TaxID=2841697 RepID=A0A8J6TAT2_9BACT|nr:RiPP maturation radical SAM protein 1 [Candidatus Desulfaltia bathyphila]MBL7194885.1 RiPP maturation radical SAM C-methyltransferase [Desulfobacterales bacterium]MBL7206917.1 RiPP maturation radical SAM C-methyltransferase [Desulfobacterales bacterium]
MADRLKPIVLVSTPWPLYSRPSIQLGALKAYLKSKFPKLQIKALHLYLKVAERIGYKLYHEISERTWPAESIYAALLFPKQLNEIKKVFYREAKNNTGLRKTDFDALTARIKEVSDNMIKAIDWGKFGLVGFSICLCQLTSSLYFIRKIKKSFPNLRIVTGGSVFAGDTIYQLLETFSEIDYVVSSEGELPVAGLIRYLMKSDGNSKTPSIPGLVSRNGSNIIGDVSFNQINDITSLPPPDYDDYFDLLKTFRPDKTFFPTLCAEISRGCWWKSITKSGEQKGCAFCNLNLQWSGYRKKRAKQVASEIDYLTKKHKTLSIAFMDNLLPLRESEEIFLRLHNLGKDLRMFAEIRATTSYEVLKAMRLAGVEEVQIGIEALSTRLLKKFNKGTTCIQNLEVMKHCEELGIADISNLILCFPGSDITDVKETLRAIDFAFPFHPLRVVNFWLGLGSPVWDNRHASGLTAVFNHPNYAALFPPDVFQSISFMIQSFRMDRVYQKKLWQPVKKKVKAWKKSYAELHSGLSYSPILSFRDGGDFLIIRQKRPGADPLTHRVNGIYRDIYLFCRTNRSLKRIIANFPQIGEDRIIKFLKMMRSKRLIYEENNRYLSLAVRPLEKEEK